MSNLLVIGESGVDQWVICDALKISPEAPSLVGSGDTTFENPAMSANVALCLENLGADHVTLLTNETPIIKRRYVDVVTRNVLFRWDGEDSVVPGEEADLSDLAVEDYDAILVSSYDKGFLNITQLSELFRDARAKGVPTFGDFKFHLGPWSRDLFCAKINNKEFQAHDSIADIEAWCQNLIVTMGDDGAVWYGHGHFPGVDVPKVVSVAGCGDTFMAALTLKYLETKDLGKSIPYANKCAAYVVTKDGVFAPTAGEVERFFS